VCALAYAVVHMHGDRFSVVESRMQFIPSTAGVWYESCFRKPICRIRLSDDCAGIPA